MRTPVAAALAAVLLMLGGCSGGRPFHIVAGSEQKILEPVVLEFCKQKHLKCQIDYKGSLDIGLMLTEADAPDVDAVWPASSLWVELYDTHRRVKDLKSIDTTPVILGVRADKARELGWIGQPVTMADILAAVRAKRLSFLMTSATQSNSGASAYLTMLAAAFGHGERLEAEALDDPAARAKVKTLLAGVARSSGSSGWLKDLYLATAKEGRPFEAMWNYEAVLKETNDALRAQGGQLLYAIYPAEGVAYADAPLGYVEHGQDKETRKAFDALQAYLLSPKVQAQIAGDGRRTAPGAAAPARPEPDWNFDPSRVVPSVALPEPAVIARALTLYQEALRRPSLTALCLDFSGSMQGAGEQQLKMAMASLFDRQQAARSLIQWTNQDHILILPFDSEVRTVTQGDGSPESQDRLLAAVQAETAGGGTDMYACAQRAMAEMRPWLDKGSYLPAIVLMTDGKSSGGDSFQGVWRAQGRDVPVFGITFGDAEKNQLDMVASFTRARVFEGGKNLTEAFRSARGYN